MRVYGLLALILVYATSAGAATAYKHSLSGKKNAYVKDAVVSGGVAGSGTSLLNVRRAFSAKAELERMIISLGDKEAKPLVGGPSYFQASMDSANNRLVLDITQLKLSKVSEAQVQRLFKSSPYVSSVSFTLDPEDKAASMVVNLKRPMKLEVFQLAKPARIVLDLKPAKG